MSVQVAVLALNAVVIRNTGVTASCRIDINVRRSKSHEM